MKVYTEGWSNSSFIDKYGEVVGSIEKAEVAVIRINTPFDPRNEFILEQFFHQGRLFYSDEENQAMFAVIDNIPTIVVVYLERPAILTKLNEKSKGLIGEFGTSDEVLTEILFGEINPTAKMPFELSSSWEAVQKQLEDIPYDSKNPLYNFGHGLSYKK